MANGVPYSVTVRDSKNQTAAVKFFINNSLALAAQAAAYTSIANAIAALTNGSLVQNQLIPSSAPVQGSIAVYENVEDKMVLVFQTASGAIHKMQVPAPKATSASGATFLADGETVDFTNTEVSALVGLVTTDCVSRDGIPFTSAVGGMRTRRRVQRRFNIRTRNPLTTGQGL